MKIHLVSDIHLEFCGLLPFTVKGDVLLLAGDIIPAAVFKPNRTDRKSLVTLDRWRNFKDDIALNFKKAYYIMGNHEHYAGDYIETEGLLDEALKDSNIELLNKEAVELTPNLMLFGATFWTDYKNGNPLVMEVAKRGMNDYYQIKVDKRNLNPEDCLNEFRHTVHCLKRYLLEHKDKNFLVMSHHSPSYGSIHPKYGVDDLNYAFSSDLSELMLDNPQIKYWVHGHTHDSFEYMIGDTKVICNPRGYANNPQFESENINFNQSFSFEV